MRGRYVFLSLLVVPFAFTSAVNVAGASQELPMSSSPGTVATQSARAYIPTRIEGWATIGKNHPIVEGRVRFIDGRGRKLALPLIRTGVSGEFSIEIPREFVMPRRLVAVVSGGTVRGAAHRGRLQADIPTTGAHAGTVVINPVTSLASHWRDQHPKDSHHKSMRIAKRTLGIPRHADVRMRVLFGSEHISAASVHRHARTIGYANWHRQKIALGKSKGVRQYTPLLKPTMRKKGAASLLGGIAWDLVSDAAKSCDPSSSPGIGFIATIINSAGLIDSDPSCGKLDSILDGIAEIKLALDNLSDQINGLATVANKLDVDQKQSNFSILWSACQGANGACNIIDTAQSKIKNLADSAQSATVKYGISLSEIMSSTDPLHQITANQLRNQASALLNYYQYPWENAKVALNNTLFDQAGAQGLIHAGWDAYKSKSFFIDQTLINNFNSLVAYFSSLNAVTATQQLDAARNQGQDIDAIMASWKPLPDKFQQLVLPDLPTLPNVPQLGDVTAALKYSVGPALDAATGRLWYTLCLDRNQKSVTACSGYGFASWKKTNKYEFEGHWYAADPADVMITEAKRIGASSTALQQLDVLKQLKRPTYSDLDYFQTVAKGKGYSGKAIATWLSQQSSVFTNVGSLPVMYNQTYWGCKYWSSGTWTWCFVSQGGGDDSKGLVRGYDFTYGKTQKMKLVGLLNVGDLTKRSMATSSAVCIGTSASCKGGDINVQFPDEYDSKYNPYIPFSPTGISLAYRTIDSSTYNLSDPKRTALFSSN
jgi:hypothetical protein